jgi:peptidoglycan hydrolase CwlO-like protein
MWQKIADLTKLVFSFGETLQQNRSDIKELQREVRQLTTALQLLAQEVRHTRETQQSEQEKTLLRLENELLKFERRLPPGKSE